jgi:hypothetical protein
MPPNSPLIPDYSKADPKLFGVLSHQQQSIIMFCIAAAIAVYEMINLMVLHAGDVILLSCMIVCLWVGNRHLKIHRQGR